MTYHTWYDIEDGYDFAYVVETLRELFPDHSYQVETWEKKQGPLLAAISIEQGLLNLLLRFEPPGERWYAFASGRNLTNEYYFHQILFQSSPGYPDTYEIGAGYRF